MRPVPIMSGPRGIGAGPGPITFGYEAVGSRDRASERYMFKVIGQGSRAGGYTYLDTGNKGQAVSYGCPLSERDSVAVWRDMIG